MSRSRKAKKENDVPLVSSEEFKDNLHAEDQDDDIEEIPRINFLQKMTGGVVRWGMPTLAMIPGTAIVQYYNINVPSIIINGVTFPVVYPVSCAAWVVVREGFSAENVLTSAEEPARFVRHAGGGSFAKGLGRQYVIRSLALLPPVAIWTALNYVRGFYWDYAMQHMDDENWQNILLLLSYTDSPAARNTIIALVTSPIYAFLVWATNKAFEKCANWNTMDLPPEADPHTHFVQKIMDMIGRMGKAVIFDEATREIMNTVIGYAVALREADSLMFGLPLLFVVYDPLRAYSNIPHPIATLDVPCINPKRDPEELPLVVRDRTASASKRHLTRCENASGLSIRLAVICGAFAVVFFANRAMMQAMANANCEVGHPVNTTNDALVHHQANRDNCEYGPQDMSYPVRIGYTAALAAMMIAVQKIAEYTPSALRNFGQWASNRWNGEARVEVVDDEENKLVNDDAASRSSFDL